MVDVERMLGAIQYQERSADEIVDIGVIDPEVGTVDHHQRLARNGGVDQGLRDPRTRQARSVNPAGAQVQAFQPVALRVASAEVLYCDLGDTVGHQRILRMVLGDEIGLEIAIGFLRRHVDHAPHAEQPHRFEDIETALDVHPHGLHRNLERGADPDDRRTMHHGVGPKLLQYGCDARPFDDLAGDKRDLALPRHEGVEPGAAAEVERQHFIPTRNQRCGKFGADEARAPGDEVSRHVSSLRWRRGYDRARPPR